LFHLFVVLVSLIHVLQHNANIRVGVKYVIMVETVF
jgi:hypothetical protein